MHGCFTIPETSKHEMFLNYVRLRKSFNDKVRHLYKDTDSLKLLIKYINPYKLKNMD